MQAAMGVALLFIGGFFGAVAWEFIYAGPQYRKAAEREHRLNGRVQAWQRMYLYAEGARVATSKAMFQATHDEADTFSRKVPDIRVVQ